MKLQEIFQIREEEFQKREQNYQEKRSQLGKLLEEVTGKKQKLDEEKEKQEREHGRLQLWENQLVDREKEQKEQEEKFACKQKQLQEMEKELLLKHSLELEKVRNEEMKLKRLTESYEYKISLLDSGVSEIPEADLSDYIAIEEYRKLLEEKEEKIRKLKEERVQLLRKVLELTGRKNQKAQKRETSEIDSEEPKEIEMEETEMEEAEETEADEREFEETPYFDVSESEEGYTREELTAETLKYYLEHQKRLYRNVEIRHSDQGELVYADGNGLQYRFLFTKPGCFDIIAKRTYSSRLAELLDRFGQKYPGVTFRYDRQEKAVYVSGYFSADLTIEDLMEKVEELSNCFKRK